MTHIGILILASDTIANPFEIIFIRFVVILTRTRYKRSPILINNAAIIIMGEAIPFILFQRNFEYSHLLV